MLKIQSGDVKTCKFISVSDPHGFLYQIWCIGRWKIALYLFTVTADWCNQKVGQTETVPHLMVSICTTWTRFHPFALQLDFHLQRKNVCMLKFFWEGRLWDDCWRICTPLVRVVLKIIVLKIGKKILKKGSAFFVLLVKELQLRKNFYLFRF